MSENEKKPKIGTSTSQMLDFSLSKTMKIVYIILCIISFFVFVVLPLYKFLYFYGVV